MSIFSDSPIPQSVQNIQTESSAWIAIASHANADTKGSYVELIASIAFAAKWIDIAIHSSDSLDPVALFDIAIGAATSEVDKIKNMGYLVESISTVGFGASAHITRPFNFASGVRLAARIEDNRASAISYSFQVTIGG